MKSKRLEDYANLLGCKEEIPMHINHYMVLYDTYTRSAESAALQVGEKYAGAGEFELVTFETQYVSSWNDILLTPILHSEIPAFHFVLS